MQDANRTEWEFTAWHFLNFGTLPEDEDIGPYIQEVTRWKVNNERYIDDFLDIVNRDMTLRTTRTMTIEQMLESRAINLRGIRTPDEVKLIEDALTNDDTYMALKAEGRDYESNPDYSGVGCAYFMFPILGWLLERKKNKSRQAYMRAQFIEYSLIDAYFRTLDIDADRAGKLYDLRNRYLSRG